MISQEYSDLGRIVLDFPLTYLYVKELRVSEEANGHGSFSILLVSDETVTANEMNRLEDVPIQVFTTDGAIVFSGFCVSAGLSSLNGYSEIIIEGKSWSYKTDIEKHSRTFQSPSKTLSEVVDTVLGSYGLSIGLQRDVPISTMLSQQDETDWHFIKRIANQFGFMMFADSKSGNKQISIGVDPFTEQKLPEGISSTFMGKDIANFWNVKNVTAAEASAYEFMKHSYQLPELSLGVGHGIGGGSIPQIVTKSDITSNQGLLVNHIVLSYMDGAYPPLPNDKKPVGTNGDIGYSEAPIQASGSAIGSSVISGTVLDVAGNDIQVQFNVDGPGGGVRWIPYASFFSNDFYCMPDIGDTVFCYYENDGTIVCLGSKHVNTSAPDFGSPENKVLHANNRMIKQKRDGIDITGSRSEMDGLGGDRIKIIMSDTDGIEISASKEVNIIADHTLLIQSNDLETVKDEPTEWFDSVRKERMANFDTEQTIGSNQYISDGGNSSYNAAWDLTKTLAGNIVNGFIDDITSPFQIVSTIGDLFSSSDPPPEPPKVSFEKVDEFQIMILGLQTCTLQVPGSSIRFSGESIVISGPKFWWFGFNRSSDYPQQSESQQTFMDSLMDAVQLALDVVGCIPGCNVICGAINAGISLLRGDYYGAVSGVMGMLCPGGGLVTRGLGMLADASDTAKKVIKALKILKAGALALNATLLGGQDLMEIIDQVRKGEFDITNAEDLALVTSLFRNTFTAYQSGKDLCDEARKPKEPDGDATPNKDKDKNDSEDGDGKPKDPNSTDKTAENQETCHDPIDVITGSQKIVQTDFIVKDITESFQVVRTYQSVHTNEGGLLGSKWYLNLESWISIQDNSATVIMPDMHLECFTKIEGRWINDRGGDQSVQLSEGKDEFHLLLLSERKRYTYNSAGRLVCITDKNNNNIWLRYVGNTLMEATFTGGQCLKFDYSAGKIACISDLIGRTIHYRYKGELLAEVEYPNHGVIQYSYTPEGYLQRVVDQNGHSYVYNDYDLKGRVTRQILSTGQEYVVLYDDSRRVNTFLTVQNGRRFEYHYTVDQLLRKKVYTDGTFEEMQYDECQNKIYIKDRMGGELHRKYDASGRLLEEQLPNGLITYFTYDEFGNLICEKDNAGRHRESVFDERGNCIVIKVAIDEGRWQETVFEYDSYGRVVSITDPCKNKIMAAYEETHGGMISFTTAEGAVYSYTYDEAGRRMSVTDEFGRTEYGYNHLDYLAMEVDPLGNTTKYFFDMLCNLTKIVKPNQYDREIGDGPGTRYYYDAFDEQVKRVDPLGNVFANIRDLEENIVKEINPNTYDDETEDGEGICYEYDQDDRRTKVIYPDGGVLRIKYDANGNIIKRIQPEQYDQESDDGAGYSYEYDCVNRLVQIMNPEGIVERRYVYNLRGLIIKELDAQGYLSGDDDEKRIGTLYRYNAIGWLVEKREPIKQEDGQVLYRLTGYCYDSAGNMISECRYRDFQSKTSNNGLVHTISFAYDKDNRRIRVSDNTGGVMEYHYNSRNQCTSEKSKFNEQLFQTFFYEYDTAGRMICVSSEVDKPDGKKGFAKTFYTYDKTGNITKILLPEGGEVRREYDMADRLIAEFHQDKKSGIENRTKFVYDKAGNLTEIIDSLGRKTIIDYDLMNQEIRRIEKDGSVTRRFYDGNGNLSKLVRPNQYDSQKDDGVGYQYTYDRQGRVLTVIGPDGHVLQTNTYDANGRLLRQLDGMKSGVEFNYDLAGNQIKIQTTGTATQELDYDAKGNIIGIVDGNRNQTRYDLDDWGRITKVMKADGSIELYRYDNAGNMVSSTDGEGHTTEYQYNCNGKISAIVDPTGQTERYFYDMEGNLAEKIDRNGVTTEYGFNFYGAPLYRKVKDGSLGDYYDYTEEGLLKSAVSGGMRYAYEYDEMNRLVRKSASGRSLLAMGYDKNGNRIKQVDVTGKVTEYQFNELDLLTKIWDDGKELAEYGYHVDGTIKSEKHGPIRKQYGYDLDKNLASLHIEAGDMLLVDNQYQYDGNGNCISKMQLGGDTRYHFDPLNQLVKAEYPAYSEELYYDRAGNCIRRITNRMAERMEELYQYDSRNRLTDWTKGGVVTSLEYDPAGNLLRDGSAEYTYDGFNRTIKAETFDGNVQVNRYDAEGLRAEMEENGRLVQFIFNLERDVVAEVESNEVSRLIRTTSLIARSTDAVRMYYHYASDEMGSTTHITDEEGEVLNRYEYDAWGNVVEQEEAVENRYKYTGQQFDPITQQYYLRARFYNPVIARFTQEDEYRGAGLNLYVYCVNNPVYYVDPSGNQPDCVKKKADAYMKEGLSAEEAYRRAYAEHANDKLKPKNIENLTARERYELEQRRARLIYTEAERVTGMTRDEIRNTARIGNDNNLQVLAIYEQGGQRFLDVNPTARLPEFRTGEAIPISVITPTGETVGLPTVRNQHTTTNSHAEVGSMYQANQANVSGGDATLTVIGLPVCPDCQNTSIRTMASAQGVGTLTVNDYGSNGTYQFNGANNEFFNGRAGGIAWSRGRISNYNP